MSVFFTGKPLLLVNDFVFVPQPFFKEPFHFIHLINGNAAFWNGKNLLLTDADNENLLELDTFGGGFVVCDQIFTILLV